MFPNFRGLPSFRDQFGHVPSENSPAAMRSAPGEIAGGPAIGQGTKGAQVTGDPGLKDVSWGSSYWCMIDLMREWDD